MTASLMALVREIGKGLSIGVRVLGGDPSPTATLADAPGLRAHPAYRAEQATEA